MILRVSTVLIHQAQLFDVIPEIGWLSIELMKLTWIWITDWVNKIVHAMTMRYIR